MFSKPPEKVEVKLGLDLLKENNDVKQEEKLPLSAFTAARSAPPTMPTGEKPKKEKSLFDPVDVSKEKKPAFELFGTPPPTDKQDNVEIPAPPSIPSLKKNQSIFSS